MSYEPSIEEIEDAIEDNMGWCCKCKEFTTMSVEPDARGYECDVCGCNTVVGAVEAVLIGVF
jgi:hypothetical protein